MRIFLSALLVAFLSACSEGGRSTQAAPSGSTVSIVEVTPDTGAPLTSGQKVNLKVKVAYTLTAESGTLGLVVQDANTSGLAQTMNVVFKGSSSEVLAVEFTVPETKAIQVFVPLSAQGQSSTSTVSSRAYKVVPR